MPTTIVFSSNPISLLFFFNCDDLVRIKSGQSGTTAPVKLIWDKPMTVKGAGVKI